MQKDEIQSPQDDLVHRGLVCRRCRGRRLRVIYTRAARDGKLVRRRECKNCGTRVTTWERAIGMG
jgi:transcriptional regulator NrdR family protein